MSFLVLGCNPAEHVDSACTGVTARSSTDQRDRSQPSSDSERDRAQPSSSSERDRAHPSSSSERDRAQPSSSGEKDRAQPSSNSEIDRAQPSLESEKDTAQPSSVGERVSCKGCCNVCGTACRSQDFMTEARRFMNETRQTLAKLEERHGEVKTTVSANQPTRNTNGEVSETLFRSGRSLAALQTASEGLLKWDESDGILHCAVCVPDLKSSTKHHSGVFRYDATIGSSFDSDVTMPKRFTSLRDSVAKHFRSETHKEAKKALLEREERERTRTGASNSAATHVLRTAYLVLKKSLSHILFEELIVLQHLNDAAMGNINHSRMVMDSARSAFAESTLAKVKEHVNDQPCVAVLVDKVTVARRTVDVTAILTLVPEAEPNHLFQSFVVGAPVVKNHDGDAMASEICESLAQVGVTSANKVASIAADGQYHHNHVPQKVVQLLDKEDVTAVPALWDPAHLMNLAEGDARKDVKGEWVRDTIDVVTAVNKRCLVGKGWEELMRCGEEVGGKALRPKLWSETRFAPHAGEVFTVFRRNLELLCSLLEKRLDEETRPTQLAELRKELVILKG